MINTGFYFTLIFSFLFINLNGQEILWTYHLSNESESLPGRFWVDDDGVSHLNILKGMKQEGNRVNLYEESYMVKISSNGSYLGSMSIKNCKNRTSILPFKKNRYLIYGHNCLEDGEGYAYDSRLFNEKGKLLKTGESLPDYRQLLHLGDERVTIFSRKLDFYNYSKVNIGYLNRRLKVRYYSISIKELMIKGYGFTLGQDSPLKIGKSGWVIPFQYGVEHGKKNTAMRTTHGGFFVVNKDKISWNYIPEEKFYYPSRIELYNDQIFALVIKNNRPTKYIKIFDLDGSAIGGFKVTRNLGKVVDMKVQNEKIILLTLEYAIYYSFSGEILKRVRLPAMEFVQRMETYSDHSILIAGTRDKKTILTKVGFKDRTTVVSNEKETELIKFSSIENLSKETRTVTVFPNPTSKTLNFSFQYATKQESINSCLILILDSSGSEIMKKRIGVDNAQIDVSNFASGIYFYRILINKATFLSGQFVKI